MIQPSEVKLTAKDVAKKPIVVSNLIDAASKTKEAMQLATYVL